MKLTITKDLLSAAILRAHSAVTDRSLSQIAFNAVQGKDFLTIAATDRILAVYSSLECRVSEGGIVFLPGKLFSDMVRQLPDGEVSITSSGAFVTVEAASGFVMKLPLIEDVTWKDAPSIDSNNRASIPCAQLNYMIEQVQFCIEIDSPRNYGAVGYLHRPEERKLRLVGTDGFRLSYCDLKIDLPEDFLSSGICLSKRGLIELHRMCGEGFEHISLTISSDNTTLLAEAGNYRLYLRLSSIKYPNYRGVLPTSSLHPIKLSRLSLQSVTRRVLLAADKNHALRISFTDGSLSMSSRTAGSSESHETLQTQGYKGAKTNLAINGKYLADVFSNIASEELTLQFKTEDDPIIIVPREEPFECRSMHVLVPIRENA